MSEDICENYLDEQNLSIKLLLITELIFCDNSKAYGKSSLHHSIATYIFTNGVQYRVLIMLYSDSFIMLYINLTKRHAMQSMSSVTRVHNTEAYLKK